MAKSTNVIVTIAVSMVVLPFWIIGSVISMLLIKMGDIGYWLNNKGFSWNGKIE